ncbi:hypothetical protein [Actinoplanes sp. NPDC049118]|uniref:hypothetical protein n=1 Tax=Actinoplanes sp. NPDC049118 TaxID=3155769 RepID=UPI0033DFC4D7
MTRELSQQGTVPDDNVAAIVAGLSRQTSVLALLDATDELLASVAFADLFGVRLHRAYLAGHAAALDRQPMIASVYAEGALRLAAGGRGHVLRTLELLTRDDVATLDADYVERLPRLIGIALDVWGTDRSAGEALRDTLASLVELPAAAADAAFERGLDLLRHAATGRSADPLQALLEARRHLAGAEAAEESRPDAALYGAGVDAVMAFFRGDRAGIRAGHAALCELLDRRTMDYRRSHVPEWRRPRIEAAYAWARLVAILGHARQAVAETVWLDAWEALDAVLDAYVLDRAVLPVIGDVDSHGLAKLIQPVIESELSRRQMLLAQLRKAVDDPRQHAGASAVRRDQLRGLRDRLDILREDPVRADGTGDNGEHERLVMLAPSLLAELGGAATTIAGQLDDDALTLMEGITYNATIHRARLRDPVIAALLHRLAVGLQPCPDYRGPVRQAFDALIVEMVTFLATRHDLQRSAAVDYLQPMLPPPREARLQDDFADWLRRGPLAGHVDVEVTNVATGRADIKVGFGATRFFVEVKRELRDAGAAALERSYLIQAADYSGTSATLGVLLVLDLTAHPAGVRHLAECAWVTRWTPPGSTVARYLVVAVVIGNRSTPSAYSRNAR